MKIRRMGEADVRDGPLRSPHVRPWWLGGDERGGGQARVELTVLYGHPDDPGAFEEYYAGTHMPMVPKIPNLVRYEAARVAATPDGSEEGGGLPYYRTFEGYFEGYFEEVESLRAGMSTPEGQAPPADLPNFATGGATIFISEIDA